MEQNRILLAGIDSFLIEEIKKDRRFQEYAFDFASDVDEAMQKVLSFKPELVFVSLFLPKTHGIDFLKQIKKDPRLQKIGVVVVSAQNLIQNYRISLDYGAEDFFLIPFTKEEFFDTVKRHFDGGLSPRPLVQEKSSSKHIEIKRSAINHPYLKFWGTRGSSPVSGSEYVRFGGDTSCLEVRDGDDLVIIDAGTGIRNLGIELIHSKIKKIHIVLSHYHWDHLIGLPFFAPLYIEGYDITIYGPMSFDKNIREIFALLFSSEHFPIRLDEVRAKIDLVNIEVPQKIHFGKIQIESDYTYHPGATLGFKIHVGGKQVAYVTDNEVLRGYFGSLKDLDRKSPLFIPYLKLIEFFHGCDLMIHEAQYFPEEYEQRVGWGHSSFTNASAFMKQCNIKKWIVTHHDPLHSDLDLQIKIEQHRDVLFANHIDCMVRMAFDHMLLLLRDKFSVT